MEETFRMFRQFRTRLIPEATLIMITFSCLRMRKTVSFIFLNVLLVPSARFLEILDEILCLDESFCRFLVITVLEGIFSVSTKR